MGIQDSENRTIHAELTAHLIETAEPPASGQRFIRDTKQPGLALRITERGTKSYVIEAWTGKRSRRKTLGKVTAFESLKDARRRAKVKLGEFATGRDIVAEEQAERVKGATLKDVYKAYLRSRDLKPGTVHDYNRVMNEAFKDWQNKTISSITPDMVERLHHKLGETSRARTNNAMRVLRALFNYAAARYDGPDGKPAIVYNPTKRISATRAWHAVDRRRTVIKAHELKAWYEAVIGLEKKEHSANRADVVRDYLLLLLFTGLRRTEAARLQFDSIDFQARTLTITDTKNRAPHTLPLSDYLYDLLIERRKATAGKYVFPGTTRDGYLQDPRKQMAKVTEASGVTFQLHDLRRTFITIAESLDIPAYALKQLLNHKDKADVTAGYIVINVERLREPMQKISDFILKSAGVKQTATVTPIRKRKAAGK